MVETAKKLRKVCFREKKEVSESRNKNGKENRKRDKGEGKESEKK